MASTPLQLFQVFLSSTYEDLRHERAEAIAALLEVDCIPVGMEYFPAADVDQWTAIQRIIDSCDYYVLITAGRYGSVEPKSQRSYTELEYEYALEKGIPVLSFVHHDVNEISGKFLEATEAGRQALERFHNKVKNRMCRFYSDPHSLASSLKSSIVKLKDSSPRPGWFRATPETAGYLPIRFDLNDSLLKDDDSQPRAIFPTGPLVLGHGISLKGVVHDPSDGPEVLCAVATDWGPFGEGVVRSGWFFHPCYPTPMPEHTFAFNWLLDKNMRHAAVFFKVHAMPDGTGYVHLSTASQREYEITLKTSVGATQSGLFSWQPQDSNTLVHDLWSFSCDYSPERV